MMVHGLYSLLITLFSASSAVLSVFVMTMRMLCGRAPVPSTSAAWLSFHGINARLAAPPAGNVAVAPRESAAEI